MKKEKYSAHNFIGKVFMPNQIDENNLQIYNYDKMKMTCLREVYVYGKSNDS